MFKDMPTGEIINALEPLVPERLSGKIIVDGVLLADTEAQAVVDVLPVVADYDQWGFSGHDEFGCVRIHEVDKRINEWLNDENIFKQQAAKEQSQWFGLMIPSREYEPDVKQRLRHNTAFMAFASGWTNKIILVAFRFYGDLYINLDTGETKAELTDADRRSRLWGRNKNYQGDVIPNHSAVSWGNLADPEHPSWKTRFAPGVHKAVFSLMDRRAHSLEVAADRAARGAIPPTPGRGIS